MLVNDLWAAGAEAISIGGVRLQPRSAIRQAGGSILVDNRPVFWPITIEAIGDPAGLQVKSVGLPGFGRFSSFAQLYDIEFDVSAQQELTLPGGSGRRSAVCPAATRDRVDHPGAHDACRRPPHHRPLRTASGTAPGTPTGPTG